MNITLPPGITKFLKQTFFVSILFSSSAFAFMRLMVYPLPIEFAEDGLIFLRTVLTGWALVMLGKGIFEGLVFVGEWIQHIAASYIQTVTTKVYNYKVAKFFSAYLPFAKMRQGSIRIYNKGIRMPEVETMLQD